VLHVVVGCVGRVLLLVTGVSRARLGGD
jgi:hypothetical protein